MTRQSRGTTSYHAGLAAEEAVGRTYRETGYEVIRQRWRGTAGEVDLIAKNPQGLLVFVEVKAAKTMDRALHRLQRRQMDRLCAAASEFVASEPLGQLTPMRFDLAAVDQTGAVQIIENAFGAD